MQAVQEIELALSDLEHRLELPTGSSASRERIRIAVQNHTPVGLGVLLGIVSPGREWHAFSCTNFLPDVQRKLPTVRLSWGESPALTITLQPNTALPYLQCMKNAGIPAAAFDIAVAEGVIKIGEDFSPPWNISDPEILVNLLIETCASGCPAVSSMVLSAPIERLRHLEITTETEIAAHADIVWLVLPSGEFSGDEKTGMIEQVKHAEPSAVFPMIDMSKLIEAADGNRDGAPRIESLLDSIELMLKGLKHPVFPALPIGIVTDKNNAVDGYLHDFIALALDAALPASIASSERKHAFDTRSEIVMESALAPPDSICGLLRQKTILSKLKSLPDFPSADLKHEPFEAMRKRGIEVFSEAAAAVVKKTAMERQDQQRRRAFILNEFLTGLKPLFSDGTAAETMQEQLPGDSELDIILDDDAKTAELFDRLEGMFDRAIADLDQEAASCRKEQKKYAPEPDNADIDFLRQEAEAIEQLEYVWGTLIRLDLHKVKLKTPGQEIHEMVGAARNDFFDYLNLTPADEKEFSRCLTAKWPNVAKKYTKKMHRVMEDTCQLWEITINQELDKIEEYRLEHSPRSPKFPVDIMLKASGKPMLPENLDIKLKKPALAAKIFNNREKGLWRSEVIMSIQKAAENRFSEFEKSVDAWFESIRNNIDSVKNDVFAVADGIVRAGRDASEKRAGVRAEKARKRKKLHDDCMKRLDGLAAKRKEIESCRTGWNETREILHNTECVT